ncbi:PQQ-dependent sugar dehydrogenase [Iamia sp.]|uniref:PQQ-dependent sugar dehydrogenase n=1 Tax=Iamia sp. TaxID=2722710 RepID=UPI002C498464|nr:PQQ-dependent sugar dehydrogenase [Iamia sp.]HXH59224.1 PQQ-dependent sugar dehydrogenase [Iamia sp.]
MKPSRSTPPTLRRTVGRTGRLAVAALALAFGSAGLAACETAPPTLTAQTLVAGLSHPWDLSFTPSGSIIWTERGGRIVRRQANGATNQLAADLSDLWVSGETGLMGVVVDPRFNANRRVYTCQGWTNGSRSDVRVIPWVANAAGTALARQAPIVTGMPASSGRHGGCRLRFDDSGRLYVGTGDATIGTTPQSLTSLGGKVLRVDPDTGAGVAGNPFASSADAITRRIWSYGHRNVQGLAIRPADGTLWSAEHGPDRDDEINRGQSGNHGWDPVPGYNEDVPMTDTTKFPSARTAAWSSGVPTVATSGITWLSGSGWKGWDDRLVVATLKGQSLLIMQPQRNGTVTEIARIYQGSFGRIRTAQLGPDGLLYLTTSNGSNDRIIRITPS